MLGAKDTRKREKDDALLASALESRARRDSSKIREKERVTLVKKDRRSTTAETRVAREEQDSDDDDDGLDITGGPLTGTERRFDGTVIENLTIGPIDHLRPKSDPDFDRIEPNSRIRLK